MISKEKIEEFKIELERSREVLLGEIAKEEKPVDFGSDVDDSSEEADEAEEFANRAAIVRAKKDELEEIEEALQKIEKGTYGICNNCGGEIGEDVLNAAPESALCVNCKKGA